MFHNSHMDWNPRVASNSNHFITKDNLMNWTFCITTQIDQRIEKCMASTMFQPMMLN
jgi:hypothetical protein